jgi:hypothetical protein
MKTRIVKQPLAGLTIALLVGGIASVSVVRAEEPYLLWATTYAVPASDDWNSPVAVSPTGEVHLRYTAEDYSTRMMHLNAAGTIVATNTPDLIHPTLIFDELGNQYMTGGQWTTNSDGTTSIQLVVRKQSPDGSLIWEQGWEDPDLAPNSYYVKLQLDAQGNTYVAGSLNRSGAHGVYYPGDGDGLFVRKYDKD